MSSECTLESSVTSKSESCKMRSRIGSIPPLGKQMLASSIASSVSVITLNPLQVVKIQYQNSATNVSLTSIIKHIYTHNNGIQGFWSGSRMGLLQAVPNTVLYMSCYEYMKLQFHQYSIGSGIAGAISRTIAVSIVTPLELIRTIQSNGSALSGIQIAQEIYRKEGMKGFYRGWQSSVLRDAPYSAIYWYSFDRFKLLYSSNLLNFNNRYQNHKNTSMYNNSSYSSSPQQQPAGGYQHESNNNNNNNTSSNLSTSKHVINFKAGASAGIIAAIVTHPFDVLKTQQQLSSKNSSSNSVDVKSGVINSHKCGNYHNYYSYLRASSALSSSSSLSSHSAYYSYIMNTCHSHTCVNTNFLQYHLNSTYYTPSTQSYIPSPPHHQQHSSQSSPKFLNFKFPIFSQLFQITQKGGGVQALYKGLSIRLATVIPGSAIVITVYEAIKHFE